MLLRSRAQASHSFPVGPRSLPSSQGGSSPQCRPLVLGAQPVALNPHSPGQVSTSVPSPLGSLPGAQVLTWLLPNYVWIFITVLVLQESFCQFPLVFTERSSTCRYIFDLFMRKVSFTSSCSAILLNLSLRIWWVIPSELLHGWLLDHICPLKYSHLWPPAPKAQGGSCFKAASGTRHSNNDGETPLCYNHPCPF